MLLYRLMCVPALCAVLVLTASSQQAVDEIRVNIRQKIDAQDSATPLIYLNGYRRTLHGQQIAYRSSHPDAESAIIVRARSDAHSMAWETDTLPHNFTSDRYRLIWLAGLEREGFQNSHEVHTFDLLVNGERWFRFQNRKDSTAKKWKVEASNGAVLSFDAMLVDRVGDLFGTMLLDVPKSLLTPGKPLVLEVVGEDAGSGDWCMTFQYSFTFEPRARVEPVVRREQQGESQLLRLSLDNLQRGRAIQVFRGNRLVTSKPLDVGSNILLIPLDVVRSAREIPLSFSINDVPVSRKMITVKPVNKRDIYLLSYSHNDIGYTDLQQNIERKQWNNLDEAIRLTAETNSYPTAARYKWNLEVLWGLDGYLRQCTEERREEIIRAIREGRIGVNALYANILTGLANAVEMDHFTEYARSLRRAYGIEFPTALVSDIPGFTWGIVSALAHSGVRYFSISPNPGDRIGSIIEKLGDKPFYWTSQSGQEKILTWVAAASYASFHEGDLTKLGDEKIFKLLRKLDESRYPFDLVQLPYTVGGDNGPPDPRLSDYVRQWNERYVTPRLIIATHVEMFTEFERRYGSTLPTYSGDFTPYWEDGAASSAFETAVNRNASDRLIQNEALWAMKSPSTFPEPEFREAWRNVALYDEHTWGAYNSVSEPDLPFVAGQWAVKRRFAMDADSLARMLQDRILSMDTAQSEGKAIEVTNTQSWPRTDVVILSAAQSVGGSLVFDSKGTPVPSQRLSSGELAVLVRDLPPMATKHFTLKKGEGDRSGQARATGTSVENAILFVSVDPSTGSIESIKWKRNGVNLVDRRLGEGANEFLYVPGKDPKLVQKLTNVRVRIGERGGLMASLIVDADAPGCRSYSCEIRVFEGVDRVDIINRFDKRAIRTKEAVHFAYPFDIPNGQLRYDVALGIVRPERDQIPGSCKNFFSVQSWVDVSNDQRGVTWATVDAPLIEIGAITAEAPWMSEIKPAQNFYSYVMNNYWHTNYRADQEGLVTFRYSIRPHGSYEQVEAVRFGIERRQPLIVSSSVISGRDHEPLLYLGSSGILALSTKPIVSEEAWLLQMYNPTDLPQPLSLTWKKSDPVTVCISDVSGVVGKPLDGKVYIAPNGSMYVRVSRK
jgi:alpha-mannosidase